MTSLSPVGGDLPRSIRVYDFQYPTFTVPGNSSASPYEVTNSRKSFAVNSAKNIAAMIGDTIFYGLILNISALCTSNSSDNFDLTMQYSIDNGANWYTFNPTIAWTGGSTQNKSNLKIEEVGKITIPPGTYPLTSNKILFRLAIENPTSPSTDTITLTNIQASMMFSYMA